MYLRLIKEMAKRQEGNGAVQSRIAYGMDWKDGKYSSLRKRGSKQRGDFRMRKQNITYILHQSNDGSYLTLYTLAEIS